jgi:hypothetical protein
MVCLVWRTIDVYLFKGESAHALRYFKCSVESSSSKGTAADVTSTGTQSFSMNSQISCSETIEDVRLEHQFLPTHGDQRAVGISLVTDCYGDYDAAALWRSTTRAEQRATQRESEVPLHLL